jgi:hypothetical protein
MALESPTQIQLTNAISPRSNSCIGLLVNVGFMENAKWCRAFFANEVNKLCRASRGNGGLDPYRG